MKRVCLVVLAVCASAACVADVENALPDKKPKHTKEERERLAMEKFGGFMMVPAKGLVLVVNAQKAFDVNQITNVIQQTAKGVKMPLKMVEGAFDLLSAQKTIAAHGGTGGVFIVDDPTLPISLTSHEQLWSVLNIAALREGADGDRLAKRVAKEFNRTLSFAFGGGCSTLKTSVMRPVTDVGGLDAIVNEALPFDTICQVFNAMSRVGMTPARRVSYRKACQEGWAPAPTNEFQKVIWESYKAKPTEPIRIKYDPKKGE